MPNLITTTPYRPVAIATRGNVLATNHHPAACQFSASKKGRSILNLLGTVALTIYAGLNILTYQLSTGKNHLITFDKDIPDNLAIFTTSGPNKTSPVYTGLVEPIRLRLVG